MEFVTTCILIALGLLFIFKYFLSDNRKCRPPGPKPLPLLGSVLQLKEGHELLKQFTDFAVEFGDLFEIKILNSHMLVLNTADVVNKAYCGEGFKHVFNNRPANFYGDYVLGQKVTLMSQADKQHAHLRKALTKALHIYGEGIPIFEGIIKNDISRLMTEIQNYEGKEFEVTEMMRRSICNIVTILLIGEEGTDKDYKNYMEFIKCSDMFAAPLVNNVLVNLPSLRFAPFIRPTFDKLMGIRRELLERLFFKMKDSRKPGKIRGLTDWYLEEQDREVKENDSPFFTDEVIQNNLLDIMVAGIITTSTALPSILLCLANNPEYQTKIQQELDHVIGQGGDPTFSDRRNCDLLEAVVMESMRLIPPTPLLFPHMCSENTKFEGFDIQGGSQVVANIWNIHHDEKVWGDPWVFRPERFLDTGGKLLPNTHVYMKTWMPFGMGRRRCPGLTLATSRMFLYLAHLLQKWRFIPSPGKCGSCDPRGDNFSMTFLINPKPFYCTVKERH